MACIAAKLEFDTAVSQLEFITSSGPGHPTLLNVQKKAQIDNFCTTLYTITHHFP